MKNPLPAQFPFPKSNRLRVLLLAFLIVISFLNISQNDLIGDDGALFGKNRFYKSLESFQKIFTRELVMSPGDFDASKENESFSGCISYRPVTVATIIVDYAIWKGNAAGHHFMNIIFHLGVTILAFYFFLRLTRSPSVAFFAAALFAVHPVQSEAVNTISYRSDILMTFFYLAAVLAYWRYSLAVVGKREGWLLVIAVCYFLGLFTKESALILPAVLLILDRFFIATRERRAFVQILNDKKMIYIVLSAIAIFYLCVYFILIPNAVYLQNAPQAHAGFAKMVGMLKIFLTYAVALILPSQVSILPPLYAPPVYPLLWWEIFIPFGIILSSAVLAWRSYHRNKIVTFGVLWFFLTYIPVSGIAPLLNPLAYRFLYLPSLGFFLIAAISVDALCGWLSRKHLSPNIKLLFKGALIGLCVALTIALNSFFKNNFVACKEMIRRYPESSRPYWILGLEYYRAGNPEEAIKNLQKHLTTSINNPFISDDKEKFMTYHLLGIVSQDPDVGIAYLKKARSLYPGFVMLDLDLAKSYLAKKDYTTAMAYAQNAVERDPSLSMAYVYVVHIAVETGDFAKAHKVLEQAVTMFGETPQLKAVKNHLNQQERTP